jgi:hypothetical protein
MSFPRRLKKTLRENIPGGKVKYFRGWKKNYTGPWLGTNKLPVALMLHHTAGAATESTSPKAAGNQTGANSGIVNFVQNHYRVPAANFTLDRDGTVYVHAANPIWHAGVGSFKGKKPWDILGCKDNQGNRYMMGVEIVSRGKKKDFTKAQKEALKGLQEAVGEAALWPVQKRRAKVRRPRHKDWTQRKIDIIYDHPEIDEWMK